MYFEDNTISFKAQKNTQKKRKFNADDKIREKEIIDQCDLNSDALSTDNNDQKSNPDNQKFDLCSFYTKNLSEKVLKKYGTYYLQSFFQKNSDILPENFMKNHKISSYKRSKMVNWMLEIFCAFQSSEETFLNAVEIMDKFFYYYKKRTLTDDNVQLIGMGSLFIASKTYDLVPIRLEHIIHQIGHDKFTKKKLLTMERSIMKAINFDVFSVSGIELMRFFLYDFYINNKKKFQELKAEKQLDILTNCSIWTYKLCKHYEEYSSVRPAILCMACLMTGYDFMRLNCDIFYGKIKDFFKEWLNFLYGGIGKKKEVRDKIQSVYKKITNTYHEHRKSNLRNLMIYHELFFD